MLRPRLCRLHAPSLALLAGACIPYTVGTTARTVAPGETTRATSVYFIPNALSTPGDSVAAPIYGVDVEFRHGLDERSDVGVRLLPAGVAVNYKRRVDGDTSLARPALAFMTGAGIVNGGEHAHFEATLLASGGQDGGVTPYGGLRAMQVVPITRGAVHDSPTLGLFGGLRLGDDDFVLSPEIGVFYDRSALHVRNASVIVVPALTLERGPGSGERRPPWWMRAVGWLR
jgi:hypothetical protein